MNTEERYPFFDEGEDDEDEDDEDEDEDDEDEEEQDEDDLMIGEVCFIYASFNTDIHIHWCLLIYRRMNFTTMMMSMIVRRISNLTSMKSKLQLRYLRVISRLDPHLLVLQLGNTLYWIIQTCSSWGLTIPTILHHHRISHAGLSMLQTVRVEDRLCCRIFSPNLRVVDWIR